MIAGERHRFEALDAWRGIAALAVAFRHINGTAPFLANAFHDNLSRGVDFFFVLSGFVIAFSYGERLGRGFSFLRFMVLRWGRIWPLHGVMVLLYLGLECALLIAGQFGGLAGREAFTGPRDLVALPASFLLAQAWIWPGRDLWNVQSWSVSVELGLYLGAGLLWRWLGPRALAVGAGLAFALGILALPWIGAEILPAQITRGVVGFGLGMGCWALWPVVAHLPLARGWASVAECALVAVAGVMIACGAPLLPIDLVFAAMVLVFGRERGVVSRVLLTAPLRWLGVLSYGLYLVHGLVFGRIYDLLGVIQRRAGAEWVHAQLGGVDTVLLPTVPAALLVIAMMAAGLGCAWLAWRFVEWPARNFSRRIAAGIGGEPPATSAPGA